MSTRLYLLAIVAALIGPGLIFTALLISRYEASERAAYESRARTIAQQVANAIDRDVGGLVTTLQTLSTSAHLESGDFERFYGQAAKVKSFIGADVGLRTPDGQQIVNTRLPFGAELPRTPMPTDEEIRATGRPVVTDVFIGTVSKQALFAVVLDLAPPDRRELLLHISASTSRIADIITRDLPEGWVVGVGDSHGNYVARSDRHAEFTGKPGVPAFVRQMVGDGGTFVSVNPFGDEILVGYARSPVTGWTIAASIPRAAAEAPLHRDLMMLTGVGLVALAISTALTLWLWGQIVRPLRRLTAAGSRIGTPAADFSIDTPIREIDTLVQAMAGASRALAGRDRARNETEARLRAVIDTVPVGVIIAEAPSGRIVSGNPQTEEILGLPVLAAQGTEEYERGVAYHADGRPVDPEDYPLTRVVKGEARAEIECLFRRPDGREVWIRILSAPIRDEKGVVTGAVAAVLDIDREKRAEIAMARANEALESRVAERTGALTDANEALRAEIAGREAVETQLRQVQKMEAIGQLSGGIAHDFNNMLAVIIGGLNLAQARLARGETNIDRYIDAALHGAERAATLTSRLLAFARQQALVPSSLDANALVGGMAELLHRTIGENIRLETIQGPGLWRVHADPGQLENAILNLAVNARDAMPAGGRLVIETNNVTVGARAGGPSDVPSGDYVSIIVRDTGEGMPADVAARAFDPFFTTKEVGKGTGLGLSQVYGFVSQSGGHVLIRSRLGKGTAVEIYLPRRASAPGASEGAAASPRPIPHGRETLLLVEDEDQVRNVTAASLRELGYTVIATESADRAEALLDDNPQTALLFTDIVMPDVDGRTLAERVGRHHPSLKVLFMTGFTRDAAIQDGIVDAGVNLLQKPFTLEQLAVKVRSVLDTAP